MAKRSKRHRTALEKVDRAQRYPLEEALKLALETPPAKFDETVELAVRLGVDPRQADQNVRGTCQLPHGTGKTVRVLVFAKGDKVARGRGGRCRLRRRRRARRQDHRRELARVRQGHRDARHDGRRSASSVRCSVRAA